MKFSTLLVILLFLITFQIQPAYSQKTEIKHTFKIVGKKSLPDDSEYANVISAEYDTASVDHIYISEFKKNGQLVTKSRFKFKGEKFNLADLHDHLKKGDLIHDGISSLYSEDNSLAKELMYKEEKLLQKTFYYPNGNRQMLISGNENLMNGEYKLWYPNGQLNFSGNYRLNVKTGEFQQFDEAGELVRKGNYLGGKLISGEAVVQDIIFEQPDQPAKFAGGDTAFNDFLRGKTSELKCVKELLQDMVRSIDLKMNINKSGEIQKIDILSNFNQKDMEAVKINAANVEILNAAFGDFKGFLPARVEDVPVSSILALKLFYTNKGLQTESGSDSIAIEKSDAFLGQVYSVVEQMPEFPGGDFREFIMGNLRYPVEAAEKGIDGIVFVRFVVEADGLISNAKVVKAGNKYLDAEAVRVVRSMPRWKPGRQNGELVRVAFSIPINFFLK